MASVGGKRDGAPGESFCIDANNFPGFKWDLYVTARKLTLASALRARVVHALTIQPQLHGFTIGVPMESRSGFGRSPPPPHGARSRRRPEGGVDLISALPDEMLLLVLVRLRCVRAAAQTSVLSRRWRGLWTGLTDLALRDLEPSAIEAALDLFNAALTRFTSSPLVPIVDIRLSARHAAHASSLLRAAVRLSPEELVFTLQGCYSGGGETVVLPYFHCATSIELDMHSHRIMPPEECYAGAFSALEELPSQAPWFTLASCSTAAHACAC
uniref:F-box domain-containing protein n=1 Tax=Aegilops tauschii TaxID=37682 RepID=M8AJC3_AEGTA